MKKLTTLGVLAAAVAFATAIGAPSIACAQSNGLMQTGTLTVGADLTYPPYDYYDHDTPAGLDPTLLKMLAREMNVKVEFKDTRFASLILGLKANRFDLASAGMYVTSERAQQIDFVPYMTAGVSILVAKNSASAPAAPQDLCGKRVSSIQGAAWVPKLRALSQSYCAKHGLPDIHVLEFPTSSEAGQALLAGAADAQMEDSAVAADELQKLSGRLKLSSKGQIYPVVVAYGIRKGNTALEAALTKALDTLKKNGQYAALLKQYNVQEPTAKQIASALGNGK